MDWGSKATQRFAAARHLNEFVRGARDRFLPSGLLRLEQAIGSAQTVLEVGCGDRSPIMWFRHRPNRLVGIDLHVPSIEHSRKLGIHDEYVEMDVLDIAKRFGPNSFQAVVALDLIEHLTPENGDKLLRAMETVALERVIVFTPNGFLRQGEYGGNPWQRHHSGWTSSDFEQLGYSVNGLSGLKPLKGEYASPRLKPSWLSEMMSSVSQPLVWNRPAWAFQLLAVKRLP